MKLYDDEGVEIDIKELQGDSIVIARVTKEMNSKEWNEFIYRNEHLSREFSYQGIKLLFCPDWVEFKEWK